MTGKPAASTTASIRGRLENIARARGIELQLVLSDWAIERFLYRLSASRHAADFTLKGAMLFRLWAAEKGRTTWDLDLLGRHRAPVAAVAAVVREICAIDVPDGIVFDAETIRGEITRAAQDGWEGFPAH